MFFFEKKNQKTFIPRHFPTPGPWPENARQWIILRPGPVSSNPTPEAKVFWFFSSEKNKPFS